MKSDTITPTVNISFLSPELLDDNVADDFACAKKNLRTSLLFDMVRVAR